MALFLMTDPGHYEVCYQINPWMKPTTWREDRDACLNAAKAASSALKAAIQAAGGRIETIEAAHGLPDLVFPANAAVVLDGRVLLARFRHPERQGEEAVFRSAFKRLKSRGVVEEVIDLPDGVFQEGAGDAIWDAGRRLFWAGYGPRSSKASLSILKRVFGHEVVPLELVSDRYYHLDTCFCPLSGGEVLYYPAAFTDRALAAIHERVPEELRIEARDSDAAAFCVNAVNLGRTIVMATPPAELRARLEALGYDVQPVPLDPFILSGGAAYCMTLRLDRTSVPAAASIAAE